MRRDPTTLLQDSRVVVASTEAHYGPASKSHPAPELPGGRAVTVAQCAVRDLFHSWELDVDRYGTAEWNPLGDLIPPGSNILLKPNLVYHVNQSGESVECLVTHATLIEAVVEYAWLTKPSVIRIGDAPIQGCNFEELKRVAGLTELISRMQSRGIPVTLHDFRRTILLGGAGSERLEDQRALDQYVLFDLAQDSLLEDLREDAGKFRVTMYNPDLMHRTHAPGRHQYLVAREVMEADVVINLPKLKSHKKSCITGTLKNMVGMNGNKEFLPHHRKGGSETGGDCYQGGSPMKRTAEDLLDRANRLQSGMSQRLLSRLSGAALSCAVKLGDNDNLEGSWFGNDTIWRTSLDLQRLLHYGRTDRTLGDAVQRQVIHITDSIVGGDGDGPLAPLPVPSGFITGSVNGAAAEWVHCLLIGFDPARIPLTRHAFDSFRYPLATFSPDEILVIRNGTRVRASDLEPPSRPFVPPRGWQGHCELDKQCCLS